MRFGSPPSWRTTRSSCSGPSARSYNPRKEPAPPAAATGRDTPVLEAIRALFTEQTVFGPEVPPLALAAARSAGFDPAHNAIDAKILMFVTANYGQGWRIERGPYLWERGSPDAKLAELYAEEDGLRTTFEKSEADMWSSRDALSEARLADGGSAAVPELTKRLDAAIK